MATITTGVYRHLKDRKKPLCDKLKLVRLVWKSKRAFLQNKEQVLLDFLSGLILNRKKLKLQEEDVHSIWKTLCDLLQMCVPGQSSKVIVVKPSMCQIIHDSIAVESSFQDLVVLCCLSLLQSQSLCHIYTKFDQLSVLFGKLLQFIKKYDNVSSVNDNVWTLLQTVLPKYQQGQRSNSNQRMVYQHTTDKLLLPVVSLWYRTRNTKLSNIGDDVLNVVNTTLFNNDHESSYSVFLHSISSDIADKPQAPKYIENVFTEFSGCLKCKSLQTGTPPDRLRSAVIHFIPLYFKEFIVTNKITDCSTIKNLLIYICNLLEVNLQKDSMPLNGTSDDVLKVICEMLETILNLDLYDRSHDQMYRQLIQVLLVSNRGEGYFSCLINLLKLNHLIVEARLQKILHHVCSGDIQDLSGLDRFMVELVVLYSKLRQMEKFIMKLVNIVLDGGVSTKCLFRCDPFLNRLGTEIEILPQGTAVEIWTTLVHTLDEQFVSKLSNEASVPKEQCEGFIQLLVTFMSHVKLLDYTVTDINKRKVKDIMVTIATQLSKMVEIIVNNKQKQAVLYPVLLLMHVWGDVYLLMCQYTQHMTVGVTECVEYPLCISAVHYFLSPEMIEKLYKLASKSFRSRFVLDLIHVQTMKSLCVSGKERKYSVEQWSVDSPESTDATWNFKISDLNKENYNVAKWKLFTENFALFWNDLSLKQIEQCAGVIVSTIASLDSDSNEQCTFGSISKAFVKSNAVLEHRDLVTALISEVWRRVDVVKHEKSKKQVNADLKAVFNLLGDSGWLQRNTSLMETIDFNRGVTNVLKMPSLCTNFASSAKEILSMVLPSLPLPYLSSVDQGRCFIGLLTMCYHGNTELQKCCLTPLTALTESSSNVLKVIGLEVTLNAVCYLYSQDVIKDEVEPFVNTLLKSICKEGSLLVAMDSFVTKMKRQIDLVEQTVKNGTLTTSEQETVVKLTCQMITQFHMVIKRPYVREDILANCRKYVEVLSTSIAALLSTIRLMSYQNSLVQHAAMVFPVLVSNCDKSDEVLQNNFEYLLHWSMVQLHCGEQSELLNIAVKFLKDITTFKDKLYLSEDIRATILDKTHVLLNKYIPDKVQNGLDKRTSDLCDRLLSLVSLMIVSCDIDQFKDFLYKLELSMNIDLSVTRQEEPLVCMSVWYTLLSSEMSEEQAPWFIQSVHNLTGYLTSLAQQLSPEEDSPLGQQLCNLLHQTMVTCPVTKQMILTILGSVFLVPITLKSFPPIYEILNEALLNHYNTVFDIIPVFQNCSKRLLFWLIEQGDRDKLTKTPEQLGELLACVHQIDKLFTLISTHKEEFCKPVVYVVADYVNHVHKVTLLPVVKKALVSAIYKILDISDKHILAQLHTVLNQGVREVFNGLYTDYSNFYKYTGKV